MTTRAEFVAEARRWLGTRWQHQGRTLGKGVDCAGVLMQTTRAVGPLPAEKVDELEREIAGYNRVPRADLLRRTCDKYMRRLKRAEVQAGDVALMQFDGSEPQHLAIIAERSGVPYLIHALALERKVVEHRLDSVWSARVIDYYSVF